MVKLTTKILPKSILDSVKKTPAIYNIGRRTRFALGSRLGARYIHALNSNAHYNDFMLRSAKPMDVEAYRAGAVQFVGILETALKDAGRDWHTVDAAFEVGCGYGRIVRELRAKLPGTAISVCDVIDEGAQFTATEFQARKLPIVEVLGPEFEASFDLVYLLSVYTHLPRAMIKTNLAGVAAVTKPGGVVVFTTHGMQSAKMAERYEQYWLDKDHLIAELDRTGFYYERYPYYYSDYGLTWIKTEEVKALVFETTPDLEFVAHYPLAIDGHQDAFVYQKR